ISYQPNTDTLFYVSYSHGFKSGAFQFAAASALLAAQVVKPEKVDAYQAGLKIDLLDDRLRLNLAVFNYKYKDIQVPRFSIPPGAVTPVLLLTNAAKSTIRGFEVEGQF